MAYFVCISGTTNNFLPDAPLSYLHTNAQIDEADSAFQHVEHALKKKTENLHAV